MTPLYATPQWIVVKLVPLPNSKTDKLPIDHHTGQPGNAHDPAIWLPHATAVAYSAALGAGYTVGFVLTAADPFFCLDLDNCLTPTGWSPLAMHLCAALPGCSIEVSQSGRGLHIWGQGIVPAHTMKRVDLGIEFYTERRFIALGQPGATGDMSQPCPTVAAVVAEFFPPRAAGADVPDNGPSPEWRGPVDDDELIRRAVASRSTASVFGADRASFADLWTADAAALSRAYPGDPYDASSADAALAQHLAFWTGRDAARIERLMRRSALLRDKWDQREDYLVERTIGGACGQQRDVLCDRPPAAAPVTAAPSAAPRMTAVVGETFLAPAAQQDLFAGCVYVVEAHRALVPGGHLVKPEQFRAMYGGYSLAMDARNERVTRNAWEAFTESQVLKAPRADGTCFRPQEPFGAMVVDAGRTRVNTYWPVQVPRTRGDVSRFVRHMGLLLPNIGDRMTMLYFMAAAVQHQGIKFQWAPLLQGVEGNGKTLLSSCVAEAIGHRYVHWPKASKIAKQFNGWMVGKTFFAVEDIHTTEAIDVIEELKPMITGGSGLEIESKGVDQISAEICGNFIFNSNHKTGLRKTRNDRRFCVLYCAQQRAEDLARDGMDGQYMNELYGWLKSGGGYAAVAEYLWTLPIPDEHNPARGCQRAPRTTATDEAIAQSLGRVEQEILEAIDAGRPGFCDGWVSSIAVERLLESLGRSASVAPNRRRELLAGMGFDYHPALPHGRAPTLTAVDGGKPRLYVRAGHASLVLTVPHDVVRAYSAAQGVK